MYRRRYESRRSPKPELHYENKKKSADTARIVGVAARRMRINSKFYFVKVVSRDT